MANAIVRSVLALYKELRSSSVSRMLARRGFQSVLIDWITCDLFGLSEHDIVVNSATSVFYDVISRTRPGEIGAVAVGHRLIAERLPNYLLEQGPYHPCIEELRAHAFIEHARQHVSQIVSSASPEEVARFAKEITAEALKVRDNVFRKHLRSANEYWVAGRALATEAAGLLIPGVGLVTEMVGEAYAEHQREKLRWAGFICDIQDVRG